MSIKHQARRGDTIIEVIFAITIFAVVSVIAINLMNAGVKTAQTSLELTMARNEMDAQSEAIRFIHNSFLAERELATSNREYQDLWFKLSRDATGTAGSGLANNPTAVPELSLSACSEAYDASNLQSIYNDHAFVVNTRAINPNDTTFGLNAADRLDKIIVSSTAEPSRFTETATYPRIIYTQGRTSAGNVENVENSDTDLLEDALFRYVGKAEGIWVISTRDVTRGTTATPEFFDFHIRTCWYAPGQTRPSTIGTIIRLYNPELVEAAR